MALCSINHNITKAITKDLYPQITGRLYGARVDWKLVSPRVIQDLAYQMFEGAGAPEESVREYFNEFNRYIYGLLWE